MNNTKLIAVFSDNRETKSSYLALSNSLDAQVLFRERNKAGLQSLLEQDFSLIFIEILQPVLSEIEFVDQIHGLVQGVPIILVSSYFYDTKELVFGSKISDFVMKPFTSEQLYNATKAVLSTGSTKETPAAQPEEVVKKVDSVVKESKKLSVLLEISRSLSSITDFDELLNRIISLAADTLNAERATLFIRDKKTNELWSRTGIGIEKQEIRFPMNRGIAGEVAVSGTAQIIDDPYSHPKFNKEVDLKTGFKTRNILCLPMKNVQREVIGVFQILNKREGDFTREDLQFLDAMAASTGIAIENALLHEELKRQLQEITQAHHDLYIAQNQILKEARFAAYSETLNYLTETISQDDTIEQVVHTIRTKFSFDSELNAYAGKIEEYRESVLKLIHIYLEDKRRQL